MQGLKALKRHLIFTLNSLWLILGLYLFFKPRTMKHFILTNEQTHHVYSILNHKPASDMIMIRRINVFFSVIDQAVIDYETKMKEIREEAEKKVLSPERLEEIRKIEAKGAKLKFTTEEQNAFNKEVEIKAKPLSLEKIKFACEREAFAMAKNIVEKCVPENHSESKDGQPEQGVMGRREFKLFAETCDALDKAEEIKK